MLVRNQATVVRWVAAFCALGVYFWVGQIPRTSTTLFQVAGAALFLLYVMICWRPWPLGQLIVAGLLLRAAVAVFLPTLSDDLYRFLWDGLLLQKGVHPMLRAPVEFSVSELSCEQLQLREVMNSASYLSPYPPIHQAVFFISTLSYSGVEKALLIMRCLHGLSEVGVCLLLATCLRRAGLSAGLSSWYFLHPTSVLEGVGNVHFEPYVIFFLLLCCYALARRAWGWAGVALAGAVATKLLPLILLPYIIFWLCRQGSWRFCLRFLTGFSLALALLFLPLWHEDIFLIHKSIGLYMHTFEFNASVYFLLQGLLVVLLGYEAIVYLGPVLWGMTAVGLFVGGWIARHLPPPRVMLYLLAGYFFLATTVHPWYLLPLVALGVLEQRRWPLLWGYVALWSYVGYSETSYTHPYFWVAVAYLLVCLAFLFEKRLLRTVCRDV